MRRARVFGGLLAGLLLLAGQAQAQVSATTTMVDRSFNAADCNSNTLIEANFSYFTSTLVNAQYTLFGVNATTVQDVTLCYNQPSGNNILVDSQIIPIDGLVILPEDHEITVADFLGPACDGGGYNGVRFLCMRVTEYTTAQGGGLDFVIDTQVPEAPSDVRWQGSDQSIVLASVSLPAGALLGETLTYVVEMRPCSGGSLALDAGRADSAQADGAVTDSAAEDVGPEDVGAEDGPPEDATAGQADAAAADSAVADASKDDADSADAAAAESLCDASADFAEVKSSVQLPITIGNLQNGRSYEVRVKVQDGSGNRSPASAAQVVVPEPEFGFWDVYEGGETGVGCDGCSASSSSVAAPWLLAVLGLGLAALGRARGRGRHRALLLALVGLMLAGAVRAEPPSLGLRLGAAPYKPEIDTEPGANDVYKCVFEDKTWVLLATGLDYIVFDWFGTLTAGGELAYFTVNGHERSSPPSGGQCGSASSSRNTLHMMPLSANLHYRFDWPYHQFHFPLAPYARAGLLATPWAITRNSEFQGSEPASGVRTGWQYALGLAFVLDVVDEVRMQRVRDAGTFQHAYLYAEFRDMRIDSFGEPGFRLGSRTWMVGVNLDI